MNDLNRKLAKAKKDKKENKKKQKELNESFLLSVKSGYSKRSKEDRLKKLLEDN